MMESWKLKYADMGGSDLDLFEKRYILTRNQQKFGFGAESRQMALSVMFRFQPKLESQLLAFFRFWPKIMLAFGRQPNIYLRMLNV